MVPDSGETSSLSGVQTLRRVKNTPYNGSLFWNGLAFPWSPKRRVRCSLHDAKPDLNFCLTSLPLRELTRRRAQAAFKWVWERARRSRGSNGVFSRDSQSEFHKSGCYFPTWPLPQLFLPSLSPPTPTLTSINKQQVSDPCEPDDQKRISFFFFLFFCDNSLEGGPPVVTTAPPPQTVISAPRWSLNSGPPRP